MKGLVQGNLGKSYITRLAVSAEIRRRFPNTLKLAVPAILVSMVLGIAMGLLAATNVGRGWDALVAVLTLAGISLPGFWLALLLMLVFSIQLDILPVAGDETWRHYPLPVTCLSVYSIAFITRMTRSSVLEVIGDDYVTTARAKGLHPKAVLLVHVLRNALIPVITIVGLRFGYMLGGAVVVETVFNWPGMGRMIVDGVRQRDIPMVQGGVLVFALAFILINLTVDIVCGIVDPRIRRFRG
jgi:ABC-type dipeptide/oligopeptide/nickel transport system permease component